MLRRQFAFEVMPILARRAGRTNAAKPMDGRERPLSGILVRNAG